MKKNVGAVDRLIRFILGIIIIAWGIYANSWFALVGIIPPITALLNWCPVYVPFKISTIKRGDNKKRR